MLPPLLSLSLNFPLLFETAAWKKPRQTGTAAWLTLNSHTTNTQTSSTHSLSLSLIHTHYKHTYETKCTTWNAWQVVGRQWDVLWWATGTVRGMKERGGGGERRVAEVKAGEEASSVKHRCIQRHWSSSQGHWGGRLETSWRWCAEHPSTTTEDWGINHKHTLVTKYTQT